MSAFDSTSNFNATFTNSYATVSLDAVSTAAQLAAGHARNTGKRYFEFVVDQAGNKPEKLWLGVYWGGGGALGWAIGGNSETGTIISAGIDTPRAPVPGLSLASGDVIGFAIDFDGGESPDGSSVTASAPGVGQVAVSKNGVWTIAKVIFPRMGVFTTNGMRPFVVREKAGGLSIGAVTLRVDSLSFSYQPTGWSEWGQSGGVTIIGVTTQTWAWVPTVPASENGGGNPAIGAQWTLTGSTSSKNFAYHPTSISGSTIYQFVRTDTIPSGYTTRFEVWRGSVTFSENNWNFYFVNERDTTITESNFSGLSQPGVCKVGAPGAGSPTIYNYGSLTSTNNYGTWGSGANSEEEVFSYRVQAPGTRIWLVGKYGNVLAPSGTPSLSLTASNTLYFVCAFASFATRAVGAGNGFYINDGRWRLRNPLLPGEYSTNFQRGVTGGETWWIATGTYSTTTPVFTIDSEVWANFQFNLSGVLYQVVSNTKRSTGKRYFELHFAKSNVAIGVAQGGGVRNEDSISFSQTSSGYGGMHGIQMSNNQFDFFSGGSGGLNIVTSLSGAAFYATAYYGPKFGFAVDMDAGKGWVGYFKAPTAFPEPSQTLTWVGGGDPVAGTLPTFSFTASSTLRVVFYTKASGAAADNVVTAAFEDGGFAADPPTGYLPWSNNTPVLVTTTATITPSVTITPSSSGTTGGGNGVLWPFGVRP